MLPAKTSKQATFLTQRLCSHKTWVEDTCCCLNGSCFLKNFLNVRLQLGKIRQRDCNWERIKKIW